MLIANGDEGFEEQDAVMAYRIGLKKWVKRIDSNMNPDVTGVFFTVWSSRCMESASLCLSVQCMAKQGHIIVQFKFQRVLSIPIPHHALDYKG